MSHGLGGSIQVDPSQCNNKNYYYHNFKIKLEDRPGQCYHGSRGSTQFNTNWPKSTYE
jgi:hypothetical protein